MVVGGTRRRRRSRCLPRHAAIDRGALRAAAVALRRSYHAVVCARRSRAWQTHLPQPRVAGALEPPRACWSRATCSAVLTATQPGAWQLADSIEVLASLRQWSAAYVCSASCARAAAARCSCSPLARWSRCSAVCTNSFKAIDIMYPTCVDHVLAPVWPMCLPHAVAAASRSFATLSPGAPVAACSSASVDAVGAGLLSPFASLAPRANVVNPASLARAT